MQTGSGKRPNYNRTTGSRTAKLYSKRTAKRINKVYQNSQAKRIRNIQYDEWDDAYDRYDEYYDNPRNTKKQKSTARKSTTIIAASLIVVVLALVIVGLSLLNKPNEIKGIGLVEDPTTVAVDQSVNADAANTADTASGVVQAATFEESDPPVIYGVMPIVVYQGHSVAYKQGIYVTDDTDANPTLEIDNEAVDLSTPGTYIVSYIARDKDGNVTRETTTVTVLAGQDEISDEEIYALADSILDYIITEDEYTDALKCLKVYEYLHAIGYVDEVHSEDWMQNAYWMLTLREGDCFCYYSAARLLLTRLGYDVMEVRNNNNYVHFWCLVSTDSGETWWHFDPTCWSWGEDGVLCLVSDNYLSEFTRRHRTGDGRLIHAWDRTNYPATPEYDFWTDEERDIIYEGGLIERDPFYDPDDDIWTENNGWDYYNFDYTDNYVEDAEYTWTDTETQYPAEGELPANDWEQPPAPAWEPDYEEEYYYQPAQEAYENYDTYEDYGAYEETGYVEADYSEDYEQY